MVENLENKVILQKVEGPRRLRGTLGPLLCVAALGSWLNAGAAYALEVPPEAALMDEAELPPITLNPPGESLVFGANEDCFSLASAAAAEDENAANVQLETDESVPGDNGRPEEVLLEPTAKGACNPLAMSFAAAGEPILALQAASSGFGFSAMLGQLFVFAAIPASIAKALGRSKGGSNAAAFPFDGGVPNTPAGAGGNRGSNGSNAPTPTPEPTSVLLFAAGAALVGRAVKKRVH